MTNELLYRFIYEDLEQVEESHYESLLTLINQYQLAPQVYYLAGRRPQWEHAPALFRDAVTSSCRQSAFLLQWLFQQGNAILTAWDQLGISAIPLKGGWFAERFYGHVAARGTSDFDVLIRQEELEKVTEWLETHGFQQETEENPGHFHRSFYKKINGAAIPFSVEVHWSIVRDDTSSVRLQNLWETAVPMEPFRFIRQLSDEQSFYFMLMHAWRHNLDSPRHYLDLFQLIRHPGVLDLLPGLERQSVNDQTTVRFQKTLEKMIAALPVSLYDERLAPYGGKNRIRRQKYLMFFDYQFFSYDTKGYRLREMRRWLLPNRFDVKNELRGGEDTSYLRLLLHLYWQRTAVLRKRF